MSAKKRKATMREALDRAVVEVRGVANECVELAQSQGISEAERRTWRSVSRSLYRIADRALYLEPLS